MAQQRLGRAVFAGVLFVFGLVLIACGGRLIGGERPSGEAPAPQLSGLALVMDAGREAEAAGGQAVRSERREAAPAAQVQPASGPPAVLRDANGNVVARGSYRQTVFRAFPPERGFS